MDSSPRPPRRGFPRGGVAILILIVATGTTFCPLVRAQFTSWDDYETVARNPLLNPPTRQSLAAFWTRPHGDLYIPVTYMVWAGVAAISGGGGGGNATGFHLFNIVLHAVAAILAYGVLEVLTKHRAAALIGALLFALHPVQVESVAWVSGMKDVLFGVLALAAIYAYLRFATCEPVRAKRRRQVHYAVATTVFVLAMLAKPTAMVLPVVIIMLDRVMLGRPMRDVLGATWPWLLLAVPCAVATIMFQPAQHAADAAAPLWARPLVAADALAFYLYKLIWPAKLTFDYGRTPQVVRDSGQLAWTWVVPVIVAAAAWWAWRRGARAVAAGLMVMVIVLLPVLGLVPFDFQVYSTVADHYLYLAMLGPALIVAWLLSRRPTIPVLVTAACVVAICGVRSFAQTKHWQNSHALFTHALDVNPRSFAAYSHLASMANETNRPAEAIALIKRAIDIRPDAARYAIYAEALRRKGDTAGAMSAYREALRQDENYATALANLAVMLAEAGRLDEAIPLARRAVEVEPHVAQNRFNLALMYLNDNQPELARRELEAVLRSDPNHSGARELTKQGAAGST